MTLGAQWHKMKKWCEISHVKMLQYLERRKGHGPYYEILIFFFCMIIGLKNTKFHISMTANKLKIKFLSQNSHCFIHKR